MANLLSDEEELRRFNAAQSDQPWYARALPMEGRATILPFRDTMPGSVFNKRELALPGLLAEAVNAFTSPARSLLGTDPEFNPQKEAANMALNMFGGGIATGKALTNPTGVGGTDLALNVWHGTPHEIKGKFDISKVGTGEGAQAYGHGMYFGEARGTGEQYARMLAGPEQTAADYLKMYKTPEGAISALESGITPNLTPEAKKFAQDAIDVLKSGKELKGNLYKVDIPDAAIPMMLDWDKPLSSQSSNVQELLKIKIANVTPTDKFDMGGNAILRDNRYGQIDKKNSSPWLLETVSNNGTSRFSLSQKDVDRMFGSKDAKDLTGEQIYARLTQEKGSQKAASEYLNSIGVKGIRYLDAGSRNNTSGTSNFVVFDPSTVKILEKNDIKIEDLIEKGLLGD
jgi:hypothetical protein